MEFKKSEVFDVNTSLVLKNDGELVDMKNNISYGYWWSYIMSGNIIITKVSDEEPNPPISESSLILEVEGEPTKPQQDIKHGQWVRRWNK